MNYIVQPQPSKRKKFYNYLIKNNYEVLDFDENKIINSPFPFIINNNYKVFSILDSITCCAQASTQKKIITVEEFLDKQ